MLRQHLRRDKMEEWMKKAWIAIGFFVLIVPLGILITWNYGDAWGEWGSVSDGNTTWIPKEYSGGAPLPDYNVPGWENKIMASLGIDKTLSNAIGYIQQSIYSEKYAKRNGLLQGIDGRVKIIALLFLIISAVYAKTIDMLLFFILLSIILAVASKIPLSFFIPRVWFFIPLFTGIIVLPATLNVVTPGKEIFTLMSIKIHAAEILVARVAATSSFAILITLTTRWNDTVKAMHDLKFPKVFVLVLSMSYRYIFLLLDMIKNMLLSRKSRVMGKEKSMGSWKLYSPIIASLFMKAFSLNSRVYYAMLARGFGNEPQTMKKKNIGIKSVLFLLLCISLAMTMLICERQEVIPCLLP